jgi:hypothetical protein
VSKVGIIQNSATLAKYEAACKARAGAIVETLYTFHGSREVKSIASIGFRVGGTDGVEVRNGAVYGAGVYTSKFGSVAHDYGTLDSLILCEAAVTAEDCREPHVVIRNADRVLPKYVIEYELSK